MGCFTKIQTLSLTNQNKQLYLLLSHCLSCFHSRFTFIRFTFRSKDKLKLWAQNNPAVYAPLNPNKQTNKLKLSLDRASAERKTAALIGRKPACFPWFRPLASHTGGVVFVVWPLFWYGLRPLFRSPLARQTAVRIGLTCSERAPSRLKGGAMTPCPPPPLWIRH